MTEHGASAAIAHGLGHLRLTGEHVVVVALEALERYYDDGSLD